MKYCRTLVILNPRAGKGKAPAIWSKIHKELSLRNYSYDLIKTTCPGDATQIAAKALTEGYEMLVGVGGDGTINELVNAPIAGSGCGLAVVPGGSGNDFARILYKDTSPEHIGQTLVSGKWEMIDLASANGRNFINIAGVGFDAEVAAAVNQSKLPGYVLKYAASIFRKLPTYTCCESTITFDGQTLTSNLFMAAVANGRFYGGGIKIAPMADAGDGWLNLIVARDIRKVEVPGLLLKAYKGTHITNPKVRCLRGRTFTVESSRPLWVQADGEIIGKTPVRFDIIPSAVRIRVP